MSTQIKYSMIFIAPEPKHKRGQYRKSQGQLIEFTGVTIKSLVSKLKLHFVDDGLYDRTYKAGIDGHGHPFIFTFPELMKLAEKL